MSAAELLPASGPLSIVLLIFGGCCSNVFALEAMIKAEPSSGMLITFFQFVFTALASIPTQIDTRRPRLIKTPKVPVQRWAFIALMFFAINIMNNWAFAFSISVPMHIILRSFSSVTTMLVGLLRGKRYSPLQIGSVMLLTVGVIVSAWADSEVKGKKMSIESNAPTSEFATGVAILLISQITAAYMGAYVEDTYAKYKASWTENLFYGHILSLPLFVPFSPLLRIQYVKLAQTKPLDLRDIDAISGGFIPTGLQSVLFNLLEATPRGIVYLLFNAMTQLACISGVNLVSAQSSAVTVTIVLNIRKLVSFILSTIIFRHHLSGKMLVGSALVFGSGALYGWETSWRLPQERKRDRHVETNGSFEKKSDRK